MDDLLIYLRALCGGDEDTGAQPDPVLLQAFQDAGATAVLVTDPDERELAEYPVIILGGEEGEQLRRSDNGFAKFFRGKVRVEILTRQRAGVDDDALSTLRMVQARLLQLLLGDTAAEIAPVKGQIVSDAWRVDDFAQVRPTGMAPSRDPTVKRWVGTYDVLLNRMAV